MKLGMIVECQRGGPDEQVYPYMAKRICGKIKELKAVACTDKKKLMQTAGDIAQTLLTEGYDYVIIIWDRMPKWGGTGKCGHDIEMATESLKAAEVKMDKVFMICINSDLESWLIADGTGVTNYFNSLLPANRQQEYFGDYKTAAEQVEAKIKIEKYNNRYNDTKDNIGIARNLPDLDKVAKRNPSFGEFKASVEKICP